MNIDTSSLLTLLSTKIDKTTKQTIEKLSIDGKVNIPSILKEKSIQTLLNSLFQDISNGTKTKNNVNQLLSTNKQVFDIKTISYDIKNILNFIEQNPKLDKQSSVLKEFLVSIDSVDDKILKSNIKNSGVFLESKLLKSNTTLSQDIKTVLSKIKEHIQEFDKSISKQTTQSTSLPIKQTILSDIKNSVLLIQDKLENIKANIPDTIKAELKSEIGKVLEQIKSVVQDKIEFKSTVVLKDIESLVKNIENKLIKLDINQSTNNSILNSKTTVTNDLKAILLQVEEHFESKSIEIPKDIKAQIEKIQTQIEFYQLLSYTTTSNYTFLPFSWEELDDADIKFSSQKKDSFSCQINLSLKEYGELKVLLQLDNQNKLTIDIGTESFSLKQTIQQNLQKLRVGINSVGLMLQNLNVFDTNQTNTTDYGQNEYAIDKLSFDLDIKA